MNVGWRFECFCSDKGLTLERSANILFTAFSISTTHKPYVDTLYVLLPRQRRPKLVLVGTSIPLSTNQYLDKYPLHPWKSFCGWMQYPAVSYGFLYRDLWFESFGLFPEYIVSSGRDQLRLHSAVPHQRSTPKIQPLPWANGSIFSKISCYLHVYTSSLNIFTAVSSILIYRKMETDRVVEKRLDFLKMFWRVSSFTLSCLILPRSI